MAWLRDSYEWRVWGWLVGAGRVEGGNEVRGMCLELRGGGGVWVGAGSDGRREGACFGYRVHEDVCERHVRFFLCTGFRVRVERELLIVYALVGVFGVGGSDPALDWVELLRSGSDVR